MRAKYLATKDGPANRKFEPGVVTHVHADGSLDINYDDGDSEEKVLPKYVKAEGASKPAANKANKVCQYGCVLASPHQRSCKVQRVL